MDTYGAVIVVAELRPDCGHCLAAEESGEREERDGFGDGRHIVLG